MPSREWHRERAPQPALHPPFHGQRGTGVTAGGPNLALRPTRAPALGAPPPPPAWLALSHFIHRGLAAGAWPAFGANRLPIRWGGARARARRRCFFWLGKRRGEPARSAHPALRLPFAPSLTADNDTRACWAAGDAKTRQPTALDTSGKPTNSTNPFFFRSRATTSTASCASAPTPCAPSFAWSRRKPTR